MYENSFSFLISTLNLKQSNGCFSVHLFSGTCSFAHKENHSKRITTKQHKFEKSWNITKLCLEVEELEVRLKRRKCDEWFMHVYASEDAHWFLEGNTFIGIFQTQPWHFDLSCCKNFKSNAEAEPRRKEMRHWLNTCRLQSTAQLCPTART